jgi:hypothetical protein
VRIFDSNLLNNPRYVKLFRLVRFYTALRIEVGNVSDKDKDKFGDRPGLLKYGSATRLNNYYSRHSVRA